MIARHAQNEINIPLSVEHLCIMLLANVALHLPTFDNPLIAIVSMNRMTRIFTSSPGKIRVTGSTIDAGTIGVPRTRNGATSATATAHARIYHYRR